jgi:hypothetical protein
MRRKLLISICLLTVHTAVVGAGSGELVVAKRRGAAQPGLCWFYELFRATLRV